MSYNYQGKKFLSLPEQVEVNKRNIEQLKRNEYRTFTTLLAIENLTYLELNQLVENSRNVSVGDLIYGSDAYYGQVTRVGGSVVEFTTVGMFGRPNMVNITYQELKDLRDDEKLDPGTFYRITDYETTTVQVETRSAGNLFDVIVQALDNKTLSENAQAIHSVRDTNGYFNGMRLEAWELKYTLENDRLKYYWADPIDGKGVIYQMIDEYGNNLPYDFKNIQFKRYLIDEYSENPEFEGKYYALKNNEGTVIPSDALIDSGDFIWAYTFTTKIDSDSTYVETTTLNKYIGYNDEGGSTYCEKNVFGNKNNLMWDLLDEYNSYILGNNVIYSELDMIDEENPMPTASFPNLNTIGNGFNHNTIGDGFYSNTIGNYFHSNIIGFYFNRNIIRNEFYLNNIYYGFQSNIIGDGFFGNTIVDGFSSNTIGDGFYHNTVGDNFSSNTIGNSFNYNTTGNGFYHNTTGNYFSYNTIRNNFYYNTIGDSFYSNTIGNYFYHNTTGNDIKFIMFSVDGANGGRIRYLHLKSGLQGSSNLNKLSLYYNGLYHRLYPTTFERIANGNIVSIHQATPLVWAGKKKTSNTSGTWGDI